MRGPRVRAGVMLAVAWLLTLLGGALPWGLPCGGLALGGSARAAGPPPLYELDTSSPRATLAGFLAATDAAYADMAALMDAYQKSGQLYLTPGDFAAHHAILGEALAATKAMDVSRISPILRDIVVFDRLIQLREILDRIALPPPASVPDRETMARLGLKTWRIPQTAIAFTLQEDGPRAGEYLLSADTVDRLPDFYARARAMPYRPGPGQDLAAVYTALSGRSLSVYEAYLGSPAGLGRFIPPRWLLRMPDWAHFRALGMTAWQWLGLAIALAAIGGVLGLARALRRWLDRGMRADGGVRGHAMVTPLALILVAEGILPLALALLRVGGGARVALVYAGTTVFFLAAAWLCALAFTFLGDLFIRMERLRIGLLDSQLVRLVSRGAGVVGALGILVHGASELGFPAYSIVAGLGVGGLAVALAARETLANLLGSILILFEKPFRVGNQVRVGGTEGEVEDVGFRSVRIRTLDNSLVSIPSNAVVNATIENLTARTQRRQRFLLQVAYETPRARLDTFCHGISGLIAEHGQTTDKSLAVRLHEFGESSLNILVVFNIAAQDRATELAVREEIMLGIMELAGRMGVEFAYPTRTVHLARDGAA